MIEFGLMKETSLPLDNEVKRYFGGSSSKEKSRFVTKRIAGAAEQGTTAPMVREVQNLIRGSAISPRNIPEQVLSNAQQFAGGQFAGRNLGGQQNLAGVSAALAPLLFEDQQRRDELAVQEKGTNLQALLETIGLSLDQVIGGTEGTRKSQSFSIFG